jgi:hypothetical protein
MLPDSVAAKRKHLKTREGGRFDPDAVARRLDALRAEAGVEPKEIGPAIWPNQKEENATREWWKRANSRVKDFDLGEIEAALDFLIPRARKKGAIEGRYLPGFPFIDLWAAEKLERGG